MTTAKKAAPKTAEVEVLPEPTIVKQAMKQVKSTKRSPDLCKFGGGAYRSPADSAKCTRKADHSKKPGQVLCAKHELIFRAPREGAPAKAAQKVAPAKQQSKVGTRRASSPPKTPITRVPFAEPQPAMVQLVPPTK